MISAFDLASRDIGGFSDPYIRIRVGEVEFNERDKYVLDEPNPWFGTHYDFQSVFPGCAPLEICDEYRLQTLTQVFLKGRVIDE